MNGSCDAVRRILEGYGEDEGVDVHAHLERCDACRAHAHLLETLGSLPPREADEAEVMRIMAALPRARWQLRRVTTWVPAAAGLILSALGLFLLGGVPAGSSVASLPSFGGGLTAWGFSWILDLLTAVRGGTDAVRVVLAAGGIWLGVMLALAGLGGGWLVVALARRHPGGHR